MITKQILNIGWGFPITITVLHFYQGGVEGGVWKIPKIDYVKLEQPLICVEHVPSGPMCRLSDRSFYVFLWHFEDFFKQENVNK